MRKFSAIIAALFAVSALVGVAAPSRADHLNEGQESPCREAGREGEHVVGYADADGQRELPTIYYNTADPAGAYIGVCGGGSAGEPVRYLELRLTPGGPYVYGSDGAGGLSLGDCASNHQPIHPDLTGDQCVAVTSPTGGIRDAAVASETTSRAYTKVPAEDNYYQYSQDRVEVAVTQDAVTLKHHTDDYGNDWSSDAVVTTTSEFFARRTEDGTVKVGHKTSSGCTLAVTDDLRNSEPPAYSETPAACAGLDREWVDAIVEFVEREAPPAPNVPPGAAACRPLPEPGEQVVPLAEGGPATLYFNTDAPAPYAGVCAGGRDDEAVRFVEVRETAGGPYVYHSDGTEGRAYASCVPVPYEVMYSMYMLCATAESSPSETALRIWLHTNYDYNSDLYNEGVAVDQHGVSVFSYSDYGYGDEYHVLRSAEGEVEVGHREYGIWECEGLRADLSEPGLPEDYSGACG